MVCIGTPLPSPSTLQAVLHLYQFHHHVSSLSFCTFFIEVDHKEDIGGDTVCQNVYAIVKCSGVERVDGVLKIMLLI
jgi:hypothetical protein